MAILRSVSVFEVMQLCSDNLYKFNSGVTPGYRLLQRILGTPQACRAEDRRRAEALRQLDDDEWVEPYKPGPHDLAEELLYRSKSDLFEETPASALCMREWRLRFLGATLDLAQAHRKLPMRWITAWHQAWSFSPTSASGWHYAAVDVPRLFRSMLRIAGVMSAPGFFIAYKHAIFDPASHQFVLQFRGLCAGEKLARFQDLPLVLAAEETQPQLQDHVGAHPRYAAQTLVRTYHIRDLVRQLGRMMPNRISEFGPNINSTKQIVTKTQRVREPYHSAYLMWAEESKYQQVVILSGISIENNQFVLVEPTAKLPYAASLLQIPPSKEHCYHVSRHWQLASIYQNGLVPHAPDAKGWPDGATKQNRLDLIC